ncbi:putative ubiquitin-like-specific protease 1B isoform X1 [Daucus carota subsp. sativus]|uniref:putative ubiquitin-like-specific protease 1B isoform X1 n=1 Tax=Daucus carota subsp. sativus TaxID=79200 RepID=UPI0030833E05
MDKSQLRQYLQSTMSGVAGVQSTIVYEDPLLQNVTSNIQQFARTQFAKEKWEYKKRFHLGSLAKIISELNWSNVDYEKLLTSREDKKYRRDDWNVAEHRFSGEVELDTDVAESFCEILKRELNTEHKCYIISPLCWGANVRSAGLDFHFKHSIHCAGNEKTHIGVIDENHFFSIHVIFEEHKIYIMDSLYPLHSTHRLHVYLLLQHLQYRHEINKSIWEICFVTNNLKQENGSDCGVFMLKSMESWLKGIRLPFSKEHANNARHILIRETLDKKLLPEEN